MGFLEQLKEKFNEAFSETGTVASEVDTDQAYSTDYNPLFSIVKKHSDFDEREAAIVAAKLGFLLRIIYADGYVDNDEVGHLIDLITEDFDTDEQQAAVIAEEILDIDSLVIELYYLSRILNKLLSEEEKKDFVVELFHAARADNEYSFLEEKQIRLIHKYLFISHEDFIKAKQGTLE